MVTNFPVMNLFLPGIPQITENALNAYPGSHAVTLYIRRIPTSPKSQMNDGRGGAQSVADAHDNYIPIYIAITILSNSFDLYRDCKLKCSRPLGLRKEC